MNERLKELLVESLDLLAESNNDSIQERTMWTLLVACFNVVINGESKGVAIPQDLIK